MKTAVVIPALLLGSSLVGRAQHHEHDPAVRGADSVPVSGLVKMPFRIAQAHAAGLRIHEADTIGSGSERVVERGFKGVLLKDVILKAGVDMPEHKDQGRYLIVVAAADGYVASFAYNELMLSATGDHTFLLWEEDGNALGKAGPFALVCYSDRKRGPRHVKWVKSIDVRKI